MTKNKRPFKLIWKACQPRKPRNTRYGKPPKNYSGHKHPSPPLRTKERKWTKSDAQKANVLAELFANVFKPYNSEMPEEYEREILLALETPGQLVTPLKEFTLPKVRSAIKQMRSRKAPGYDLIKGKIVQIPDYQISE